MKRNPQIHDPDGPSDPNAGIFGLDFAAEDSAVVLVPVPFDATASYGRRAAEGPKAILRASHQLDLFDLETGKPYECGIAMLPEPANIRDLNESARELVDAARAERAPDKRAQNLEEANRLCGEMESWVFEQVSSLIDDHRIVGTVGGDHSTALGAMRAHLARHPNAGVLQFDAHADLRKSYEGFRHSHASVMRNLLDETDLKTLVQVGIRDLCAEEVDLLRRTPERITTFFDRDIAAHRFSGEPFDAVLPRIVEPLPEQVYISFDIDGLDPTLCPHTGTPVPGGLSFNEAIAVLGAVTRAGHRVIGFDLTEVAPGPEGDEWDGNVAARILYKLCGFSLPGVAPDARAD